MECLAVYHGRSEKTTKERKKEGDKGRAEKKSDRRHVARCAAPPPRLRRSDRIL